MLVTIMGCAACLELLALLHGIHQLTVGILQTVRRRARLD